MAQHERTTVQCCRHCHRPLPSVYASRRPPRCRDQRRCSPVTLITIAIALAPLYVAALIIGHALSLFVLARWRAHVHRPPSTLPSLVDCCLFTPAIAANVITVAVAVATATTIADLVLLFLPCWEYFFPELATDINFK